MPIRRMLRIETASVSTRPDPASACTYESRLAALHDRAHQRELARLGQGSAGGASGSGQL
eukprot:6124492-Pyramimonas_sp.AAC.1